jgi:hypothetical protein
MYSFRDSRESFLNSHSLDARIVSPPASQHSRQEPSRQTNTRSVFWIVTLALCAAMVYLAVSLWL